MGVEGERWVVFVFVFDADVGFLSLVSLDLESSGQAYAAFKEMDFICGQICWSQKYCYCHQKDNTGHHTGAIMQ